MQWGLQWSLVKEIFDCYLQKTMGSNLIKFNGVQLPGGITLNGRETYEDAVKELEIIEDQLRKEYELPPMDLIG